MKVRTKMPVYAYLYLLLSDPYYTILIIGDMNNLGKERQVQQSGIRQLSESEYAAVIERESEKPVVNQISFDDC
jgi:diketogulonate reductase-like aldo/keto reductase